MYYTGAAYPASYSGNLFHLEYVLNRLYRVVLDDDRFVSHSLFFQLQGGAVDLAQGPDGNLYYTELHSGRIQMIRYTGSDPTGGQVAGEVVTADETVDGESGLSPLTSLCGAQSLAAGLLALGLVSAGRRARLCG